MTHQDIYTKFMIEYDKANVTSSYPSLTEYEVATVLDKAYNALIAQKVTGNNVRRSNFESDVKAIADLAPLVVTAQRTEDQSNIEFGNNDTKLADNTILYPVPNNMLYFLQASLYYEGKSTKPESNVQFEKYGENLIYSPWDTKIKRTLPVTLVNHEIAKKFFSTAYNMPWVKQPVCYIEDKMITVVHDPIDNPNTGTLLVTYIKTPNKFAKDLDEVDEFISRLPSPGNTTRSYFKIDCQNVSAKDLVTEKYYTFECNDTVAEELISLAVAFALENVESSRLNSKLNMRGLEA